MPFMFIPIAAIAAAGVVLARVIYKTRKRDAIQVEKWDKSPFVEVSSGVWKRQSDIDEAHLRG